MTAGAGGPHLGEQDGVAGFGFSCRRRGQEGEGRQEGDESVHSGMLVVLKAEFKLLLCSIRCRPRVQFSVTIRSTKTGR